RLGARIDPFVQLSMTISEREGPSATVIAPRPIAYFGQLVCWPHRLSEVAVVNAVSPFVRKDESIAGTWVDHVRGPINDLAAVMKAEDRIEGLLAIQPTVH